MEEDSEDEESQSWAFAKKKKSYSVGKINPLCKDFYP